MVICLFGESCTGKSTVAEALHDKMDAQVFTGKDYLKLAKNESDAKTAFVRLLKEHESGAESVIYVVSELEHLSLLPDKTLRVYMTAELDVIKSRFAARMHGNLPAPVAAMLERKHGMFDGERHDLRFDSGTETVEDICERICGYL